MAKVRFDDKAFRTRMVEWIEQVADNDLSRAMRELEYCCPDDLLDDGTLYKVCREAMALAWGEDIPVEPDSPAEPPTFQLLEGGKI